jgi:hypothetical protein
MNITVYLPDEIGEQAKAADINLSRLLRDAVTAELHRREVLRTMLKESQVHEVAVEDRDGNSFTGRITGRVIAEDEPITVFLTDDERVLVYDEKRLAYWEADDPQEDLRDLSDAEYAAAMQALGLDAIIDL